MTLHDFLEQKAAWFSAGNMAGCASLFDLPGEMSFGERILHIPDEAAIVTALGAYRSNLLVESYARTEIDIQYVSEPVNGLTNVLLTWRDISQVGGSLSELDANYILRDDPEKGWRIKRVEYIDPGKSRLMEGLGLI